MPWLDSLQTKDYAYIAFSSIILIFNFYTIRENKRLLRVKAQDEFWLQKVYYPNITDITNKLTKELRQHYQKAENSSKKSGTSIDYILYKSFLSNTLNSLRDSCAPLKVHDRNFPIYAENKIDELDDWIAENQDNMSFQGLNDAVQYMIYRIHEDMAKIQSNIQKR